MKFVSLISLLLYPINSQILVEEEVVMVEEIEIRDIRNIMLISVDKEKVLRPAYIVMFQDIVRLLAKRNTLRNFHILRRRLNNKRKPTQAIQVMARRMVFLLILYQGLYLIY